MTNRVPRVLLLAGYNLLETTPIAALTTFFKGFFQISLSETVPYTTHFYLLPTNHIVYLSLL